MPTSPFAYIGVVRKYQSVWKASLLAILLVIVSMTLHTAWLQLRAVPNPRSLAENHHRILNKAHWGLLGPVKRIELYGSKQATKEHIAPTLLETVDFDRAGRATKIVYGNCKQCTTETFIYSGNVIREAKETISASSTDTPQLIDHCRYLIPTNNEAIAVMKTGNKINRGTLGGDYHHETISYTPHMRLIDGYRHVEDHSLPPKTHTESKDAHCTYDNQQRLLTHDIAEAVNGEHRHSSGTRYTYDAAGNWIKQQRTDASYKADKVTSTSSCQFTRTIVYYPASRQPDAYASMWYSREALGLHGPVATALGYLLWPQITQEDMDDFSFTERKTSLVSYNCIIDCLTFDRQGGIIVDDKPLVKSSEQDVSSAPIGSPPARRKTDDTTTPPATKVRSFSCSGSFLIGDSLFPDLYDTWLGMKDSESLSLYDPHNNRITTRRYDRWGRLIDESIIADKKRVGRAVCRYTGNNGVITVTGRNGKVTGRVKVHLVYDRYGNQIRREYASELYQTQAVNVASNPLGPPVYKDKPLTVLGYTEYRTTLVYEDGTSSDAPGIRR